MSMDQPVSELQLNQLVVTWVPHDTLKPNSYNPNRMTWHDRMLLRQSLLEDGWTQPIVTLPSRVIVDGEQRWTVAGMPLDVDDVTAIYEKMLDRVKDGHTISQSILQRLRASIDQVRDKGATTLADITDGLVPITVLDLGDDAHSMISTIRHNRARGTHQVSAMAAITQDLLELGMDLDDLEVRLGMDDDEIQRFLHAAQGLLPAVEEKLADIAITTSLEMRHISELEEDELAMTGWQLSEQFQETLQDYQQAMFVREQEVEERFAAAVGNREITTAEKDEIHAQIEKEVDLPKQAELPQMKKFTVFLTHEEYNLVEKSLGPRLAAGLVNLCTAASLGS